MTSDNGRWVENNDGDWELDKSDQPAGKPCRKCGGSMRWPECRICNGMGFEPVPEQPAGKPCKECGGTGDMFGSFACFHCHGTGIEPGIEVKA
jgi:DnaJ-class molecular chaperone